MQRAVIISISVLPEEKRQIEELKRIFRYYSNSAVMRRIIQDAYDKEIKG